MRWSTKPFASALFTYCFAAVIPISGKAVRETTMISYTTLLEDYVKHSDIKRF